MTAQDKADAARGTASVLRRHLAARRSRPAPEGGGEAGARRPVPRTPDRIIAGAVARAAERVHALPLFFDRVTTGTATVAELPELVPEYALLSVVEGPDSRLGMVAICPGLLGSVIEMQALGRISSRPADLRRPTRTDGAICAEFVTACLAELGADLAIQPGFEGVSGFRYASFLDDPRPLGLMLEDVEHRLISISLRAGAAGQRDGSLIVMLPEAPPRPSLPAEPATPRPQSAALAATMQEVPLPLVGILARVTMALGQVQALAPGALLTLAPGVIGQATLETTTGQVVARGRLGQIAGRHALRIGAATGLGETPEAGRAGRVGPKWRRRRARVRMRPRSRRRRG